MIILDDFVLRVANGRSWQYWRVLMTVGKQMTVSAKCVNGEWQQTAVCTLCEIIYHKDLIRLYLQIMETIQAIPLTQFAEAHSRYDWLNVVMIQLHGGQV